MISVSCNVMICISCKAMFVVQKGSLIGMDGFEIENEIKKIQEKKKDERGDSNTHTETHHASIGRVLVDVTVRRIIVVMVFMMLCNTFLTGDSKIKTPSSRLYASELVATSWANFRY